MRITGGIYRGRRITCPPGVIRPAMDRMRESMFSILGPLEGCHFADIFSGSGLVGIEAASRGASLVHLVELDGGKRRTIEQNISFVECDIRLFVTSAQKFIKRAKQQYDIIYLDPPFPMKGKQTLLQMVSDAKLLREGGMCLIHFPREDRLDTNIGSLVLHDERSYGRSILRFYTIED